MKIKKWEIIPPAFGQRHVYNPSLIIENEKGEFWLRSISKDSEWEKVELPEDEG